MRLLFLLLLSPAVLAQVPISSLTPQITPEGKHLWVFTAEWSPKTVKSLGMDPEKWITDSISGWLGMKPWCLDGWKILERKEVSNVLIISGECTSNAFTH